MKILRKILLILILSSTFIQAQIINDSAARKINLKEKLIKANYQNISSKLAGNVVAKTSSDASESNNDYYFDELNSLTSVQESNDIFRISQFDNDLYTGTQDIKIPLFKIKEGTIELPITLVYHTSGIKVDQRASEVGLGWSLLAGPQINRKINIVNDWFQTNNNNPWPKPNGYFRKVRENMPTVTNNYFVAETFPDEYFVNLSGKSRKFIFTNETTPVELTKTGLKIEQFNYAFPNFSIYQPKDFNQFKITDNDGLKYTFVDGGFKTSNTEIMELNQQGSSLSNEWPAVSDWKISQIEDIFNNTNVTFEYITNNNTKFYPSISENSTEKCQNLTTIPSEKCINIFSSFNETHKFNVNYTIESISSKKYISKILFSGGKLVFNYDEVTEFLGSYMYSSEYILKSIEQFDNNNKSIKKYSFNYSNFTCTSTDNEIDTCVPRLKLASLEESNKGKYEFFYNNLPLYSYSSTKFDFLGYHTNSTLNDVEKGLYYYPNHKEWSILPYNLPIPPKTPDGQFEIQKIKLFNHEQASQFKLKVLPFSEYSKAGILERIKFPTGGEQVFVYEPNDFILFDEYQVQGAGLRIKETYLTDQNSVQKKTTYEYKNALTNKSSGLLLAPPFLGYPLEKFYIGTDFTEIMNEDEGAYSLYFSLYNKSNSNSDIINGSTIGYSRVLKKYDDGSYEEYIFKNKNDDYDLQSINYSYDSVFPGATQDFEYGQWKNDNSAALVKYKNFGIYGNGNLLEKYTYNKTGNRINGLINNYRNNSFLTFSAGYPYFTPLLTQHLSSSSPPPVAYPYGAPWTYGTYRIKYLSYFNDIINSTSINYYPSGNKSEAVSYNYINDYSNEIRKVIHSDGKITEKRYLFDSNYSVGSPEYNLQNFYNNIYAKESEKIEQNGKILNKQIVKYNDFLIGQNVIPKVSEIYKETLNGEPDNKFKIISYNEKGKIVETLSNNGVPSVTIWGYNNSLPIANIVGASYSQVGSYVSDIITKSNLDIDDSSEQNLSLALDAFRNNSNFTNFQITTYTHNPLIGVTSVTYPTGMKEFYKYDNANRLFQVIDQNGNIVKEYKYNHKH